MKRANWVTVVLLGVMLLGAGLIYRVFSANGVVPSASSVSGAEQEAVGPVIPEVTLPTLDGEQVNLLRDRGEVTILFAMSYWCTTYIPEAQALAQLYEEYEAAGLKVVVIDLDPNVSLGHLQTFIDAVGENRLTWAFDPEVQFMRRFNVQALDTTIIVDAEGREVYRDIRSTSYAVLRREIAAIDAKYLSQWSEEDLTINVVLVANWIENRADRNVQGFFGLADGSGETALGVEQNGNVFNVPCH